MRRGRCNAPSWCVAPGEDYAAKTEGLAVFELPGMGGAAGGGAVPGSTEELRGATRNQVFLCAKSLSTLNLTPIVVQKLPIEKNEPSTQPNINQKLKPIRTPPIAAALNQCKGVCPKMF